LGELVLPLHVALLVASRHGIVSRDQLLAAGLTARQIKYLIRAGLLVVVHQGVYRLATSAETLEQRAVAACAVAPDVLASHSTAARLLGLHPPGPASALHVTIVGAANRRLRDAVIHRSFRMEPIDVIDRPDGIRLTSPPRIAFDLAAHTDDRQLIRVIEEIIRRELCTFPTLLATSQRLRERGRNGSVRFAWVLASRPAWRKPPGSNLELRVEDAIVAAGLPRPERNVPVRLLTGDVIHPDLSWGPQRVVLEVDHVTWHGGGLDGAYDKWRDRQLARLGILSLRITDQDVESNLTGEVANLGEILRLRSPRAAA
jgi:Transcriptional regulator, AbiEi antitoxin